MFRWWLHLVFVYLAVVLPLTARRRMQAFAAAPVAAGGTPSQLRIYPRLIAAQWLLTGALVLTLWYVHVPLAALGLAAPPLVPLAECTAVLALAWVVWDRKMRRTVREPARRAKLLARFDRVRAFLPTSDLMMRWWIGVSITAGVCEEVLYRGFFGYYLGQWMPLWAAALVGSAVFGFAHVYQGWRGMLRTGVVGLLLWATYLATGSLLQGMVLHALIDVRSGLALRRALALEAAPA